MLLVEARELLSGGGVGDVVFNSVVMVAAMPTSECPIFITLLSFVVNLAAHFHALIVTYIFKYKLVVLMIFYNVLYHIHSSSHHTALNIVTTPTASATPSPFGSLSTLILLAA